MGLYEFNERAVRIHTDRNVGHAVLAKLWLGYERNALRAQTKEIFPQIFRGKTKADEPDVGVGRGLCRRLAGEFGQIEFGEATAQLHDAGPGPGRRRKAQGVGAGFRHFRGAGLGR